MRTFEFCKKRRRAPEKLNEYVEVRFSGKGDEGKKPTGEKKILPVEKALRRRGGERTLLRSIASCVRTETLYYSISYSSSPPVTVCKSAQINTKKEAVEASCFVLVEVSGLAPLYSCGR